MESLLEKFPEIREALSKPGGARFFKCALQVNTFEYGPKFQGKPNIPEPDFNKRLVERCLANKIEVIGVADHAHVGHIEKMRETLAGAGVTVFPGFEIASTEKIHMVCLYGPETSQVQLHRYLGDLQILNPDERIMPSSLGCLQLAAKVLDHGGIWYAAHLTSNNGLLRLGGPGDNYKHIWTDGNLVFGGQIPGPVGILEEKYQKIISNKNPDYRRDRPFALINSKDVVVPEDLDNPSASCFIKMTTPTIEAVKQAFFDPQSRIRLSSQLEGNSQSCLAAAAWVGGFLDGVRVHFSSNLNAVIGGRGAGKSTMLETLRYCLGLRPQGKEAAAAHERIVEAALGNGGIIQVLVKSQKQMGKHFVVSRRYGEAPSVFSQDGRVSNLTPHDILPTMEMYGQNEILDISRQNENVLDLLRRFLPESHEEQRRILELKKALESNRNRLLSAKKEWDEISTQVGQLSKLKEQEANIRSLGLNAKIEDTRKLARGDQLLKRAQDELAAWHAKLEDMNGLLPMDLVFLSDEALKDLPHAEVFPSVRKALEEFNQLAAPHVSALKKDLAQAREKLKNAEASWKENKAKSEAEVEALLRNLPEFAGKPGAEIGRQFVQIQKRIEAILPLQAKGEQYRNLIGELETERRGLLKEWSDIHNSQFHSLRKIVERINSDQLKEKLKISLQSTGDRKSLKDFFLHNLEGVGPKKVEWVDAPDQLLISTLVEALRNGKDALLGLYREHGMSPAFALQLANLGHEKVCLLEEIQLGDSVEVRLNVAADRQEAAYKPLEALSTGQRCTAILHLLMLENDEPLLVDQPEDNLDNAFIADRIVAEMREQKCRRQFIFATHNPNIPVFGDAEWIGALESDRDRANLPDERVGSIDKQTVQIAVKQILEGGRQAFETRRIKYGF